MPGIKRIPKGKNGPLNPDQGMKGSFGFGSNTRASGYANKMGGVGSVAQNVFKKTFQAPGGYEQQLKLYKDALNNQYNTSITKGTLTKVPGVRGGMSVKPPVQGPSYGAGPEPGFGTGAALGFAGGVGAGKVIYDKTGVTKKAVKVNRDSVVAKPTRRVAK